MSEGRRAARVGVRELRQNLSVYLRRVKEGEALEVTERDRTVARLVPGGSTTAWDQMVSDGRITPARRGLDDMPEPVAIPEDAETLTETLLRMRDEEAS